jgi:hypothetical protein
MELNRPSEADSHIDRQEFFGLFEKGIFFNFQLQKF